MDPKTSLCGGAQEAGDWEKGGGVRKVGGKEAGRGDSQGGEKREK